MNRVSMGDGTNTFCVKTACVHRFFRAGVGCDHIEKTTGPKNEYEQTRATTNQNRTCAPLTPCDACDGQTIPCTKTEYQAQDATKYSNYTCNPLTVCDNDMNKREATEYESKAPEFDKR